MSNNFSILKYSNSIKNPIKFYENQIQFFFKLSNNFSILKTFGKNQIRILKRIV